MIWGYLHFRKSPFGNRLCIYTVSMLSVLEISRSSTHLSDPFSKKQVPCIFAPCAAKNTPFFKKSPTCKTCIERTGSAFVFAVYDCQMPVPGSCQPPPPICTTSLSIDMTNRIQPEKQRRLTKTMCC